jgi:hypothetical protein
VAPLQVVQSAAPGPVQVAQVAAHAPQVRSAVAEQAAVWYVPAPQAPEQVWQLPPARYVPDPQVEHAPGPGPVQFVQLASHAAQTRSAVAVHAVAWYSPDAHAPEHGTHRPPLK